MDGWMDGWMDGRTDGQTDRRTECAVVFEQTHIQIHTNKQMQISKKLPINNTKTDSHHTRPSNIPGPIPEAKVTHTTRMFEPETDSVRVLGPLGKVVQVPATGPYTRILRRKDRHLLRLAW